MWLFWAENAAHAHTYVSPRVQVHTLTCPQGQHSAHTYVSPRAAGAHTYVSLVQLLFCSAAEGTVISLVEAQSELLMTPPSICGFSLHTSASIANLPQSFLPLSSTPEK